MEAEERPAKLRKLNSNDDMGSPEEADTPLLSKFHGTVTGTIDALSLQNSKPEECAANNEDHSVTREEEEEEEEDIQDESGGVEVDLDTRHHPACKVPPQHQQQDGDGSKPLSKNQLKKLRKREEWEAARDYRKAKRKQKTQERKARKRAAREEEEQHRLQLLQQQPSLAEGGNGDVQRTKTDTPHLPSKIKFRRPVQVPMTIIIDCSFDDLMMEKERISLGSQLTRSYSDNSRARYQTNLVISSWGGLLKERFDTVLSKHYLNWRNVTFEDGDFVVAAKKAEEFMKGPNGGKLVACFEKYAHCTTASAGGPGPAGGEACEDPKDADTSPRPGGIGEPDTDDPLRVQDTSPPKASVSGQPEAHRSSPSDPSASSQGEIVYLTSDSPYTLDTLSPYTTYIVGGLVDKNRHKGICYKTATARGVKTAKLPIGEYLEMTSRKVLATNHVVEILLRYIEEEDWGKAFLRVIPKRKGGKLREAGALDGEKNGKSEGEDGEDDDDDDDGNDAADGNYGDDVGGDDVLPGEPQGDIKLKSP
ncbi:uncharacterized protein Z519_10108 [Cladophialophora bantiana CBS 173.52]|uniref:tRNA (guanine(9)-N1)-methyltransferase n=1 Tax=Cladophialophora bantiana (strain ATCC 10958 / CBS 173.52 / CDC B-1940 / NIH 8579) TaxID=1442370 RepID=A0A0D2HEK5_CLAB1|nr:uncharacterized protein Z519_10108 [Cladophialophora bantiana CBS 173.52]KIW89255.1 hypothetical protein Z519_10108 [Cladophialophora bantiana CBS 173.52]